MSGNPFGDDNGTCYVLANDEGRYSPWPTGKEVKEAPQGRRIVSGENGRARRRGCLDHVAEHRTGPRPEGLRESMARAAGASGAARSAVAAN